MTAEGLGGGFLLLVYIIMKDRLSLTNIPLKAIIQGNLMDITKMGFIAELFMRMQTLNHTSSI